MTIVLDQSVDRKRIVNINSIKKEKTYLRRMRHEMAY